MAVPREMTAGESCGQGAQGAAPLRRKRERNGWLGIYSREETSQVAGDDDQSGTEKFDDECQIRSSRGRCATLAESNPPTCPNARSGGQSGQKVVEQDSFESLAFELPLPGCETCEYGRDREKRGQREVEVGEFTPGALVQPQREHVEGDGDHEQRDREMNQHDMLGMLGEQHGSPVERAHRGLL